MRYYLITLLLILVTSTRSKSQSDDPVIDSALMKKISVSDFCLCKTRLFDLDNSAAGFKIVNVEEMDLPKTCYGHDGRFTNGEGYYSDQYPGMILQKGNELDYIGKIRLTKDFTGRLPNGAEIDVKSMTLRDVFEIYPSFINEWKSRDCSGYWKFSNDTISFYIKIDKSIQPQFPINEAYYYDKPVEAIDLVLSCYSLFPKPESSVILFEKGDPIFFMDSIRINKGVLNAYEPNEIAMVSVLKADHAIKIAGPEGENGVIYIFTKEFAKKIYWYYFKSKSSSYVKVVPSYDKDSDVVYILNNKVLTRDYEGDLYMINDKTFIELKVIDKRALKKEFNLSNKKWGVVIKASSSE